MGYTALYMRLSDSVPLGTTLFQVMKQDTYNSKKLIQKSPTLKIIVKKKLIKKNRENCHHKY